MAEPAQVLEGTTVQPAEPIKLVCKDCKSDKGFREVGTSRVSAERSTRSVEQDAEGKIHVTWGMVDADGFDADDFDAHGVECRECGADAARVQDLAVPEHVAGIALDPGDLVTLPDGLRATVATVDREADTFTVEGWHETFRSSEGALVLKAVPA